MDFKCLILIFCLVVPNLVEGQLNGVRDFIHLNLVGSPVIHNHTNWDFDPNVASRRRTIWEQIHGEKGEKLIERLGLGNDGKEFERLVQQRARDEGHLNGLNYYRP